jgi:hypothetical protein
MLWRSAVLALRIDIYTTEMFKRTERKCNGNQSPKKQEENEIIDRHVISLGI